MSDESAATVRWSYWAIASAGLVFNFLGCINFASQMNPEAVAAMPDAYRMIVESRPAWATGAFAIAVFGGLLGCVLLLFRKPAALYVFVVSLVAAVLAQLPSIGAADLPDAAWIGWASQLAVTMFLIWFSRRARAAES